LIACAFFISVLILAATFIITHFNHTHDAGGRNGSCATCSHLTVAANLLAIISAAAATGAALATGGPLRVISVLKPVSFPAGTSTLVLLKIRLNN
jgi:hypothetical protein